MVCERQRGLLVKQGDFKGDAFFLPVGVHKQDTREAWDCVLFSSLQELGRDTGMSALSGQKGAGNVRLSAKARGPFGRTGVAGGLTTKATTALGNP